MSSNMYDSSNLFLVLHLLQIREVRNVKLGVICLGVGVAEG